MITEKDKTNIHNAAHEVWDAIGNDIFEALETEKELNPHADTDAPLTLSRNEVVEIVLDAGRIESCLKENKEWNSGMDNMSYQEWIDLIKPAFTFNDYGK
jgi:hypothetical protein